MTKAPTLLAPLLLALSITAAEAQVAPDAGSLLQQIQKEPLPALPKKAPDDLRVAPPVLDSLPGVSVTVTQFRFEGNHLLDQDALATAVAPFRNRVLSFQELQRAAYAVSAAYRQAGWIAHAYLPRQEIDNGVVTIQVVEARFGGATAPGATPARVDLDRVMGFIDGAQPVGAPLNADALDRALLLIDDLPGIGASGNLAAGARDDETAAVLKLSDEPLLSGDVGIDNTGERSTGAWRAAANMSLNSPSKRGDAAIGNLIHSEGSDYARLAYQLPLGSNGWRAGASASHLQYRLVTSEFDALDAHGSSDTLGLDARYPLIRSRFENLFLALSYDAKRFDNRANGGVTSHYRSYLWTIGLNGNLFDDLGGGGVSNVGLSLSQGRLDLDGSPNEPAAAATTRTAGAFGKLRYALSRQQSLTDVLSAFASLQGQQATKNLDSSEKFYLGGAYGVRAYPSSEAGGSHGQLLNLELRGRLPASVTLTSFYDWGHVTVNQQNDFAGAAPLNGYSLKGAGVAVSWFGPRGLNLGATWARRIGSNPNPTTSGSDQDGSLRKNRFWFTASIPF